VIITPAKVCFDATRYYVLSARKGLHARGDGQGVGEVDPLFWCGVLSIHAHPWSCEVQRGICMVIKCRSTWSCVSASRVSC